MSVSPDCHLVSAFGLRFPDITTDLGHSYTASLCLGFSSCRMWSVDESNIPIRFHTEVDLQT